MKRTVALAAAASLLAISCSRQPTETTEARFWFEGTFEEALSLASERDTLVFLDFYSPT